MSRRHSPKRKAEATMLDDLEKMCLSLVAHGNSTADIAGHSGASLAAVAGIVETARMKLGARNTLHAVARACLLGLLADDLG